MPDPDIPTQVPDLSGVPLRRLAALGGSVLAGVVRRVLAGNQSVCKFQSYIDDGQEEEELPTPTDCEVTPR